MPSQPRQLSLLKRTETRHGGGLNSGRRKAARPLAPKVPIHLTLRSSQARGGLSFLHPQHCAPLQALLGALAKRFHVRVHQYANSGNHLHLLIEGQTRKGLQDFLRAVGSQVAQLVTGARKGRPFGQFWDALAFTRLLYRGRDFVNTQYYILKNDLEALGLVPHDRPSEKERRKGRKEKSEEQGREGYEPPPRFLLFPKAFVRGV